MADIMCDKVDVPAHPAIPPDGTFYFLVGPLDAFGSGTVTVTAHPTQFGSGLSTDAMFMEVAQMATRWQAVDGEERAGWYLDVVVRNNTHVGQPNASSIRAFDAFVTVVTP